MFCIYLLRVHLHTGKLKEVLLYPTVNCYSLQILDWVLLSTYSAQFTNISDEKNALCAAGKRVLNRDGDLNDLPWYTAKKAKLNSRQIKECAESESSYVKSYRLTDKIRIDDEDVTYKTGDYIIINEDNLFGKVNALF